MENILNNKKLNISVWYYILIMLGYVLTLASGLVRPGVIATVLLIGIYIQMLFGKKITVNNTIDYLMVVFFAYNLLSGIWCVAFGMPVSIYAGEFVTGVLPVIFYFAGKSICDDIEDFYKKFIIAVIFVGAVGLILFIWAPQFYLDYLFDHNYISKADVSTMRIRMISVIGSIQLGYIAVCGMCASASLMLKNECKKYKAAVFICCLIAFLSNQRSAMFVAIAVLVYVNYLIFFTFKILPKKYFFLEIAGLSVGFIGLCVVYFKAVLKIYYRLVSLPGAVGQRSDQWVGAVNNMKNLWLGNGLGASGHRAVYLNDYIVADGGLVKMFCELGIIGASVFAFMMILVFKKGVKHIYECAGELAIIAVTLMQSIGSNILEFQIATPIFFFAVGRVVYFIYKDSSDGKVS